MNRLKYCTFHIVFIVFVLTAASPSRAAGIKGASLAIYNNGQALVEENRSVNLPEGLASVVFKDVPATLDPTSVHAAAPDMSVLDVKYEYRPITRSSLLKEYVGKELTLILPDPADANGRVQRKATLLSVAESPVFLLDGQVYLGDVEGILFPSLPKNLQREPALTLTADSSTAGKRDVRLGYLMGGLNWRADYTLTLDSTGQSGALAAWATIANTSGRGFVGSSIKLVAGDVNRAAPVAKRVFQTAEMADMSAMAFRNAPREESFSEFHVYSIERTVSLAASGTRQINLFDAPRVPVREQLVATFRGGSGQQRGAVQQPVAVNLLLDNTQAEGLGRPMPAGLVRVFRSTEDGSRLLAGEARIGHVGNGGEIRLPLGNAFDLSVERSQTSFTKIGKNVYEMSWEITVTNGASQTKHLVLRDTYGGQWEVLGSDAEYTTPDSGTLEFALDVPPNADTQPRKVNYSIRITY